MGLRWFPVDAYEEREATAGMSCAARAIRFTLRCASWIRGPLPADPERLRRLAGADRREWAKGWPEVSAEWTSASDDASLVVCPALEAIRMTQVQRSASAAAAARKLHANRAESHDLAPANAERTQSERTAPDVRTQCYRDREVEREEDQKEKKIQISESPPYPPQAGGTVRAGEAAFQLAAEPTPARRQAARVRAPRAPAERAAEAPPLPFRAAQAVAWIAEGAAGRFVAPDKLMPGHAIALEREIRERYGGERAWVDLGAAIGAGEVSWNKPGPIPIGVLVSQLAAWMPVARAWVDRGRTAIEPASSRPAWDRPMCLPVMTRRERRPEDQAAVDALPPDAWEKQVEEEKGMFG